MLEIPEAYVVAEQINHTLVGKRIKAVIAAHTPHKFAWLSGDPADYREWLVGQTITGAVAIAGMIEVQAGERRLLFSDGVNLRYHAPGTKRPSKHQLLIDFEDGTALSASVQMYGGLWSFRAGEFDNPYYRVAQEKPSPLGDRFDEDYFRGLLEGEEMGKLSAKAMLATEQRIPGLGNGVLQDILYRARIHPKQKIDSLSGAEKAELFRVIKTTLTEMVEQGGRDTEKDLFGQAGGYRTRVSKLTVGGGCQICGSTIRKESYMGGSVYYCGGCQKIS